MLVIRPELESDFEAIDEVHRQAFGQQVEADLVRALRQEPGYDSRLSLVAIVGDRVAGHILFSPIHIEAGGQSWPALALAPIGVLPELQRQGIGSGLILQGLHASQRLGHELIVVLGHPELYRRFGFQSAGELGIHPPFPAPEEAFMILELATGALLGVSGVVRYPPPFEKC